MGGVPDDFAACYQAHSAIARVAEGVVVGSALIDQIANAQSADQAVSGVLKLCAELSEGVRKARVS